MRVNILTKNKNIKEVREKAKDIFGKDVLKIGLSKTGEEPATHWFCSLECTEDGYKKLLEINENSVIEVGPPKSFLEKNGLKLIKEKS